MLAIYKREMRSFFSSAAGYAFLAIFLAVSGLLFGLFTMVLRQSSDVSLYYQALMFAYIIIIPLITMRSFAEERRTRTEQLLMTSPVSIGAVVGAKFAAAFTMFFGSIMATALYFIPLSLYGEINMGRAIGCLVAVVLVGACFIAIGIFISTLTDNQFVAGLATIGLLAALMFIQFLNNLIDVQWMRNVISFISIASRYDGFTEGIFDYAAALYYISICGLFIFFSCRVYERRRWA